MQSEHKAELSEAEKVSKVLQAEKEALTRELHRLQDEHDACHQDLAKCKRELAHAKDEVGPSLPQYFPREKLVLPRGDTTLALIMLTSLAPFAFGANDDRWIG